ncbi:unnamed protein product [Camellia sinensis]
MMEESTSTSGSMIKLNASNYAIWKPRMEDVLYCRDLFDPIELNGVKPPTEKDEDWKRKNRKTIGQIRQWIDHSVFHHVAQETDAYALWIKLEGMYQSKTARNKALLMRRLVNLKLKGGISVAEHTSEFQNLVNQLTTVKMELDDEMQALLLLSSLPDSWETLVVSLSNSAPEGKLTMSMVTDALFSEEARKKEMGGDQSHALVTENKSRGRGRGRSKSRGRSRGRSQDRGKFKEGTSRPRFKCYHCGQEGHIKKYCYALKGEQQQGNRQPKTEDGTTAVSVSEDIALFSVEEEECLHMSDNDTEWVVDTAASYHATSQKEFFSTYQAGDFGTVKMGNSSFSKIVGIGDVHIQTKVGCTMVLKDVRHVPDLRLNLISGIALDRQGYENYFGKGIWKLKKGSLVVAKGQAIGTLYKTHVEVNSNSLNAAEDETSPNLWHKRLGHMSEKGLQILAKKSLIPFAKDAKLNPCDNCLFGKHHRVAFHSSSRRQSELLSRVYSDVCGPIEVESLGGRKYFLTFIDDASRKVWVYVLKTKAEVFQHFQTFHAMVERETEKKLKCLRTDNGGEYTSKEFKAYCATHGIRHEKTVPGTPQHNGIAERMNRTIVEKVRCMLKMAKLPKPFWGEAVRVACYLINRSPSVPLNFQIPEEVWSGREIFYSHLRVFGCKAFAHVSKEHRQKLDDKATPCIFIGYGDEEFGYRLWDPKHKKVIRSRDVVFQEGIYTKYTLNIYIGKTWRSHSKLPF